MEHSVSEMVADVCDVEPAMTQVAAPAVQGLAWATLPDLPHYRNGVILVFWAPLIEVQVSFAMRCSCFA